MVLCMCGYTVFPLYEISNFESRCLGNCMLSNTTFSEYVRKYATEEALREQENQGVSSDSESSMSDFSEDEAQDMEL